jgi:hypothetical protein
MPQNLKFLKHFSKYNCKIKLKKKSCILFSQLITFKRVNVISSSVLILGNKHAPKHLKAKTVFLRIFFLSNALMDCLD